jgi:hypothetical protein
LLSGGCLEPISYVAYDAALPVIIEQPNGGAYYLDITTAVNPLTVEAHSFDGGTISYQWWYCDDPARETWTKVAEDRVTVAEDGCKSTCIPYTGGVGVWRYYAEVINSNEKVKGHKTASLNSGFADVIIYDDPYKAYKADAGSKSVSFPLFGINGITSDVYDKANGGQPLAGVSASVSGAALTLSTLSGYLVPKTYYVSVRGSGGTEKSRLEIEVLPTKKTEPGSLAERFFKTYDNSSDSYSPHPSQVADLFNAVHDYLALVPDAVEIQPGDWLDLPALSVAAYGDGSGAVDIPSNTRLPSHGRLLRLIVVGKNSFRSGKGAYIETANDSTPHLVFQFQNIPAARRMEASYDAPNGYFGSEMRQYLVPVPGAAGSGNFLAGLLSAGVPESLIYAPARYVSTVSNAIVQAADKLWLPTYYELFGNTSAAYFEDAAHQARLEYYGGDTQRIKYASDNASRTWWTASPYIISNTTSPA